MLDCIASFTFKVVVQCLIEACKLNIFPALVKKKYSYDYLHQIATNIKSFLYISGLPGKRCQNPLLD